MRMTVNEIKEFVQNLRHRVDIFVNRGWAIDGLVNDYTKSADTIEKLLEEVQQYREIGTVENFAYEAEVHLQNCPLRELPQKQEDLPTNAYHEGWNACIDKIMKGAEENG